MAELFTNNASSTLAAGISAVATTATVQTGEGAKYPNPGGSDFFRVVLFKKSTGEWEIAFCTARSGDILTITRAQEGTTALALNADDVIELRPTAGFFTSLTVTSANIQANAFTYDAETGAADAYVITPSPAISAYGVGQEWWFIPNNTNTGASTLSVSGVATPPAIRLIDGSALYAGALTAGRPAHVFHNGTHYILLNPVVPYQYYAGVTPGTAAASKALVLDANRDIANIRYAWTERLYLGDVGGYAAVVDYNAGTGAFTITPYDDGSEQATRQFGYDQANNRWYFDATVVAATFIGNLQGNVTGDLTGNADTATVAGSCTGTSLYGTNSLVFGAIGSYALLKHVVGDVQLEEGVTYAGSSLSYAGGRQLIASPYTITSDGVDGSTPSGTWRAMGRGAVPGTGNHSLTLCVRIS